MEHGRVRLRFTVAECKQYKYSLGMEGGEIKREVDKRVRVERVTSHRPRRAASCPDVAA